MDNTIREIISKMDPDVAKSFIKELEAKNDDALKELIDYLKSIF